MLLKSSIVKNKRDLIDEMLTIRLSKISFYLTLQFAKPVPLNFNCPFPLRAMKVKQLFYLSLKGMKVFFDFLNFHDPALTSQFEIRKAKQYY